jgi:hypothetical protein
MINIGIETNDGLVYEVDGSRGHPVWPTPVITNAKFAFPDESLKAAKPSAFGYRFREDSFDPVSRIRRGRFYCSDNGPQPRNIMVANHPARPFESIAPDIHGWPKSLEVFNGVSIWQSFVKDRQKLPLVLLGVDDRYTVWTIINVEAVSSGEDLFTLKGRNSFGILPYIKKSKIPEEFQAKLDEVLNTFADEVHRSAPASVIDRARDVASQALLAYFRLRGLEAQDLGKLINKLEKEKLLIAANTANISARLHARSKPSEQEKRELRPIREQDIDLVTQCVGSLLCEIGIAEWDAY